MKLKFGSAKLASAVRALRFSFSRYLLLTVVSELNLLNPFLPKPQIGKNYNVFMLNVFIRL